MGKLHSCPQCGLAENTPKMDIGNPREEIINEDASGGLLGRFYSD